MKNLTSFLTAALILLTAASCERIQRSSGESHTLRGKLVQSCEETKGLEGVELGLFLDKAVMPFGGDSGPKYLDRTLTEPDGTFELTYESGIKANIYLKKIRDQTQSSRLLMMGIPRNKDLDLGVVYHSRNVMNLLFTLDPKYPFSTQDTLLIGGAAGEHSDGSLKLREIPGPFSKNQVVVYLENYGGIVQTFDVDPSNYYQNMDPDFVTGVPFHFKGHEENASGSLTLPTPCQKYEVALELDSSLVGE